MANVKISALPGASTLTGAELVPVVQSGVTKQTTAAQIARLGVLTGTTTFYVSTTGNNVTGTGTALSPWASATYAFQYIRKNYRFEATDAAIQSYPGVLDPSSYPSIVISMAAGTYTTQQDIMGTVVGQWHQDQVVILGDLTASPAAIVSTAFACFNVRNAMCHIKGFHLTTSSTTDTALKISAGSVVSHTNMSFGAAVFGQVQSIGNATSVFAYQPYYINGAGEFHLVCEGGGFYQFPHTQTVTVTGTLTWTQGFALVGENSSVGVHNTTFNTSGATITGTKKFVIHSMSEINGDTIAQRNDLPGDQAGTDEELYFTKVNVGSAVAVYPREVSVIGSAGEVVATPSANAQVVVSNNGESGVAIHSGATSKGHVYFGRAGAGGNVKGEIQYDHATDQFNFYVVGALAGSWTANGLSLVGDLFLTTQSTPASAAATGVKGQIVHDTNYIYVCTATNTWKRVAIATW